MGIQVGDRVTNNRCGPITIGTVGAVINPIMRKVLNPVCGGTKWDQIYPNWLNENVVFVICDVPRKAATLEEALVEGMTQESWEFAPLLRIFSFPEADLCLLEQTGNLMEERSGQT